MRDSAVTLFEAVASANEKLIEWTVQLRSHSGVAHTSRGMDLRNYRTGSMLELWLEAELTDGCTVCWWMDISHGDDGWSISPSVLRNRSENQETLLQMTERRIPRNGDMAAALAATILEMGSSIGRLDEFVAA